MLLFHYLTSSRNNKNPVRNCDSADCKCQSIPPHNLSPSLSATSKLAVTLMRFSSSSTPASHLSELAKRYCKGSPTRFRQTLWQLLHAQWQNKEQPETPQSFLPVCNHTAVLHLLREGISRGFSNLGFLIFREGPDCVPCRQSGQSPRKC